MTAATRADAEARYAALCSRLRPEDDAEIDAIVADSGPLPAEALELWGQVTEGAYERMCSRNDVPVETSRPGRRRPSEAA
jgi:hypothetical protein